MKNTFPKPRILFDGRHMLIISRSDFAIRYIIPALNCLQRVNGEQALQLKVESEIAEAYQKGITTKSL